MPGIALSLTLAMMVIGPGGDSLAPARRGQIRCSIPDPVRKTCRTFARYSFKRDNRFDVDVRGIAGNAGLVIEYHASGSIEGGAICLVLTKDTIAQARFTKYGIVLIEGALTAARERTIDFLGPLLGKKVCSIDRREGIGIVAEVSVDGVRIPELDKPIQWIDDGDGYSIASPDGEAI